MYENRRLYRQQHRKKSLISFEITVKETNLLIQAHTDLSGPAFEAVLRCRSEIEDHIRRYPDFSGSLVPLTAPKTAPRIIREMSQAARAVQVGPMASVAGAVAEYTGRHLLSFSPEVIVENGGDLFICSRTDTDLTIFAGKSPLSLATGIQVPQQDTPFGVCTSSGTFGHSRSFGNADAVTVMARSCILADAAATALANRVRTGKDIEKTLVAGKALSGIQGLAIIIDSQIGLWGNLKLIRL